MLYLVCGNSLLRVPIHSPVSPYGVDKSELRQGQEYEHGANDEPQVVRSDVRHVGQLGTRVDAQLEIREHRACTCEFKTTYTNIFVPILHYTRLQPRRFRLKSIMIIRRTTAVAPPWFSTAAAFMFVVWFIIIHFHNTITLFWRTNRNARGRCIGSHPKRHPRDRDQQYTRHVVVHQVEPVFPG